jgi:hypothetical protein
VPSSDWDLGQKLVEQGLCTLDQVREALALQDQMKRMGLVPKPLAQVLVEKGFVREEKLRAAGVPVAAAPGKPALPRPSAARRLERRSSSAPVLVVVLLVAGGGIAAWAFLRKPPEKAAVLAPRESGPAEDPDRGPREELERIGTFQRTSHDFSNGGEVLRRYEEYQQKHRGRKWELEAHERLKAYRAKADAVAAPGLAAIRAREDELRGQGRLVELLRLYEAFPPRYLPLTDSGKVVREKIEELRRQVREAYVAGKAELERLAKEGKFEEALARLKSLEAAASAENLKEIEELRARLTGEQRLRAERARKEVADAYFAVNGRMKEALAQRPPAPRVAAVEVARFLLAERPEEQRPFAGVKGLDAELLRKAVEDWKPDAVAAIADGAAPDAESPDRLTTGEAALLDLRNAALVELFFRDAQSAYQEAVAKKSKLDLPSLGKGYFEKKDGKTVYVIESQRIVDGELSPLAQEDLEHLALRASAPPAALHARIGFFLYYCAGGKPDRAFEHLSKAKVAGAKGVQVYLFGLMGVLERNLGADLQRKFGAAEESFKARQFVAAKKLIGELLEHREHAFVKEKRPEIERMLAEAAEGTELEKRLAARFKGKAESLPGGKVRVSYDFEGRLQLDAFEFVTDEDGRKFKGRWRHERGALESSTEASVLRWRTPVQGDVALEYELQFLEDPQNVVLDLYENRGASRHYAVVLGFDWVGRADGDKDNTAEDRFGMPRTCVIKYPVSVDKERWVLGEHWQNWTSRLVGGPKAAFKPSKGKTCRLKVERAGKAVRLFAEDALAWEGEDDAYSAGSLLFFSDSRCRIDNLTLTLTPAP